MNKIHYVYKITNLKNNKIYIGVRSHPNPKEDNYMGSSKILENLYKLEGKKTFTKEIIKTFISRKEAEDYESSLLTESFCNSPNTYNIINTGDFSNNKHGFRKDIWFDYYNKIREQYSQGKTIKELGEYYNCDSGTIRMITQDIKRTKSESQKLRYNKYYTSGNRDLDFDNKHIVELLRLYCEDKWSVNRVANHFNKTTSFIYRRLHEYKIPIRPRSENNEKAIRKLKPEVWEDEIKIVSLYQQGLTLADLKRKYKCNGGLIRQILVKNNIKIRNKTENKQFKLCQK
jgi:hypothetical protein